MRVETKCPSCGREIAPDALEGLCLKCLGRLGFFADSPAASPDVLLRLGDYALLEEIARGGMGVVYRARQLSLNRIVALKVLLNGPVSSPDFIRRFKHEAQVVAALKHPNIVAIHEVGESHGCHFLALEHVDGLNFAALVREQPLPSRRAAAYLKTIAEAIQHAHHRGVLHRDLKPSNILLDAFDQPQVTDFGLAKLAGADGSVTLAGQVMGSPNYMSPEQALGKSSDCTARSDIYSLGAILYELLTSRPPFQGESLAVVLGLVQQAEPVRLRRLNPAIPEDLETICLKCLQKEPGRRYASAQALADDLGNFLANQPIRARPVPGWERAWLAARRHPLVTVISAALLLAVGLGVAGITLEWRRAEAHAQGERIQRRIAEQDAAETRANLYAADLAVASQALQNGDLGRARRALSGWQPRPGEADLRGFAWRYLWRQCRGDQLAALTGHEATVNCAAFSPSGQWLASGSQDGTVRIWDAARRQLRIRLQVTPGGLNNVAFTADGKLLMTGSDQGVAFWDTVGWQIQRRFPGQLAALAQTGSLLATADASPFFSDPAGLVRLWNWRTGRMLYQFKAPGRALSLSADGRLLAVAGAGTGITVWDTNTRQPVRQLTTREPVWALDFSPDGQRLVSAGWSSEVSVWNVGSDTPPTLLSGHRLHVWSAVFSPDGQTVVSTSSDQTVRLWDAFTGRQKRILRGHASEVWCAAESPDGRLIATGGKDDQVLLWAAAAGAASETALPHDMDFRPRFSPDGKWLVTVNPADGRSQLWNTLAGSLVGTNLAGGQQVIGFSPDGACVASFDAANLKLDYWRPGQSVFRRETALAGRQPGPAGFVYAGMSPAQDYFFAIATNGLIQVWNTGTGHLAGTMPGPAPPIRNAVLSPRGRMIAVCTPYEKVARLYDCATGAERLLAGHHDFVSGLAFSPDGLSLATGSMDGTIRLWDAATGQTTRWLAGHMQETTDVAFAPDGLTLASLGRRESMKLWDLRTGREVAAIAAPRAGIWLQFSPDGQKLAVELEPDQLQLLDASY